MSGAGLGSTRDLRSSVQQQPEADPTAETTTEIIAQAQATTETTSAATITGTARDQLSSEYAGIIPRCISDMFCWIDRQQGVNKDNGSTLDYSITATYLQIYNEVSTALAVVPLLPVSEACALFSSPETV